VKNADPNSLQDFDFTVTGAGLSAFTLDDDSGVTGADNTRSHTTTFSNVNSGSYSIKETGEVGWSLGSIDCGTGVTGWAVDGSDPTKVNITLAAKQNITCTFTNVQDKFKILVLTCTDDGDDSVLVESAIDLDDGTAQNTSTDAATTLGVDEKDLCALADFGNVTEAEHNVDIDVNDPTP
jgi:hypothetical protein